MDKMNFLEFACERCSCRRLIGAPVAAEKLERILEAMHITPTAHNKQPFRVFLLESPEAVGKVHEITSCIFRVDCLLVVAAVPGEAWVREFDQTNFATIGASIATAHTMLAIETEGLGMAWVGYFDAPRAREFFPVMTSYELIALFPIGEEAAETHPAHLHEKGKPITDLVERF